MSEINDFDANGPETPVTIMDAQVEVATNHDAALRIGNAVQSFVVAGLVTWLASDTLPTGAGLAAGAGMGAVNYGLNELRFRRDPRPFSFVSRG